MKKITVQVITLGHMPIGFNTNKIEKWKSEVFEISQNIENYSMNQNSDSVSWAYSDELLKEELPNNITTDILIAIANVPLDDDWYSRRIESNKIVLTLHEMKEILSNKNIPIENLVLYLLYAYTLAFIKYDNNLPHNGAEFDIIHDETRGCLFDMHGIKTDVVYSCNKPIICSSCIEKLKSGKLSYETINTANEEIKKIRKDLFFQLADFIKKHPIWALIISGISAILLGALGSMLGTLIYESIKAITK
ncbi:MAG: hypothetical protein GQ570_01140 [Helicobacteraceae bacterium]|nr:hypothetical protein [Helicobacteraceae bacterium]